MPSLSFAQSVAAKVALYANVGADLTHYEVDVANADTDQARDRHLAGRGAIRLAAQVAPLPLRREQQQRAGLCQGAENRSSRHRAGDRSGDRRRSKCTVRRSALPTRPLHLTLDIPSENILVAFNNPAAVRVYRINKDFTPGEEVKQTGIDRYRHLRASGAGHPRQSAW